MEKRSVPSSTAWPSDHYYRSCTKPSFRLYRTFFQCCNLINKAVETIWRTLFNLFRGNRDHRPLWLLVWYSSLIRGRVQKGGPQHTLADFTRDLWYCICILKGKRNAYFDFKNVGFIIRRNLVLIQTIYTHWYRQLNSCTNFFNFCWWRIPLAMTSLPCIGVHRLYAKETRTRKQISFEENGSLNNFPP